MNWFLLKDSIIDATLLCIVVKPTTPDCYQKSLFFICCLSVPPFGSLSSIPPLTCSWRRKIFLLQRKVPFFRCWVGEEPILYSTSCPLSRAPFSYSLSLPSHYSYHSTSFGCYYHLIAEKEWNFNKRELWYRKHTRKVPPLRTTRTEVKWSKGSD